MVELREYFESMIKEYNNAVIDAKPLGQTVEPILWKGPISSLKTPVPMLRVIYTPGALQCDIAFSSGLGVENTKLVHHLFSLQPEAFAFYHFVRIWIHIDEFSFKRYMVAIMVIFYLQNKKFLPSVVQLQEDVPETFIEGSLILIYAE